MEEIPALDESMPAEVILKILDKLTPEQQIQFEGREDFQKLGIGK
jgi:hypothetical protein